jgi:hypothetical protein
MQVCFSCVKKFKTITLNLPSKRIRIFLGGTCTFDWRKEFIDFLANENINFFNPIVENWSSEDRKREDVEKEKCDYLLFHITPSMKGVYSIVEICKAIFEGDPKKVLFSFQRINKDGEWDAHQFKSLTAVSEVVHNKGGKVFPEGLFEVQSFLKRVKAL